ncbi:MAG: signal peptidase signal peptidase [Candidatus Nomurabacteria bacterium]|nr:signal peptidase signal peptidase [Candidatus Nomurabacteria bacterium]
MSHPIVALQQLDMYTALIMMSSVTDSILTSISDISQNPVSVLIFFVLALLVLSLILAMIFPSWRKGLVAVKILEKDERPSSLLSWVIGIILIVECIHAFILQPFIVDGGSMIPTYETGQFLLVDKLSYLVGKPHRGDVMIFKLYEDKANPYQGKHLIKRVIGLPGERVVVKGGVTTIYNKDNPNGFVLDESYVLYKDLTKNVDVQLDDHHYFMMGDNRAQSYDSREWGPLDEKDIKGQALLRVYPLSAFSYEPGQVKYSK